ncbi:DB domain-containing protein [Caenorhabditis elegans]|uniref:Domain of unknown function DB domain-containing protein n=1 Tax=Caenorhabditis elegans TaxID=6239 RepID=A0A061ADX1_CAEEL|nr:protein of unknown function DB domain-containing protein [Caenorhabditis elegans]CDR32698.1 Domain of unknown function DB domain-containing protein [Caenorhabditis elegans]|eukprot:NP_001293933.1 Uncharacterized protein CELE_Y57G11C.42 [Caenorhabditis elegans]
MREKYHRTFLFLIPFLISSVHCQLSCHRIPTSFCCTSRIRDQCPEQCASVQCGTDFIHSLFSTDGSRRPAPSGAHDGNANIGGTGSVDNLRSAFGSAGEPFVTSPPPAQPLFPQQTPPPPASPLISNSGDVFARSRKEISGAPDSEQQSGSAATLRDSSVISSNPSSIPYLVRRFSSRSSSPSFAHSRAHHRLICRLTTPGRLACNRPISRLYKNRYVTPPKSWNRPDVRKTSPLRIRKKNFATTKIHITPFMGELARKRRKLDSGSSHEWKVSIIPRGQNKKPANVKSIPPFTIDGKADERFNKFYRTIDSVINNLDLTNGGNLHEREGEPQIRLEGSTGNSKDLSVESSAAVIVPRTTVAPGVTNKVSVIPFRPLHFTAPPRNGPPGVAPPKGAAGNEQCGVSPDFTPCVSNEIASKSLLECCKRKNLPAGCQQLCRYDITQTEIRAAMDRGQCGIFNVAPFLECASQGKDNSECCRHRGIVQKTGPQCEQFCRPAQGLSSLGVQHIVCGNAVGDMLHCHHSGVRI